MKLVRQKPKCLFPHGRVAQLIGLWGIFSLSLNFSGCDSGGSSNQRGRNEQSINVTKGQGSLKLSWTANRSPVTSYHVFYTQAVSTNKNGKEIDSLVKGKTQGVDFKAPSIILGKTNIDPYPAPGTKVCFYLEARNENVRSDPSSPICEILE